MGEMVTFDGDGGTGHGYLSLPTDGTSRPAVIVIQEWWALVPHIKTVADRLAAAGYVAFVPDLYGGVAAAEPDEARRLLMGLAMDAAAECVADAVGYLSSRPEVSGRIGCVGFRAGGSLALWAATRSPRIVAAAGFYPALPWARMRSEWSDYSGKAAVIHCAEQDDQATPEGVAAALQAIKAAGGECTRYEYPGTRHAFFNDDRPDCYHPQAAASAWARTLELFRARLG
ncbi:MAG TPA: dienelactone hydrolase family protein [Micromonosporaceae bacterium]